MNKLARCGYCCDLCKAYAPNIQKNDERKELSQIWKIYYDEDITAEDIYCEGCRLENSHVKIMDDTCSVKKCVSESKLQHCGYCLDYPCSTFNSRKGLSKKEAEEISQYFKEWHYYEYLIAYDNKTRISKYLRKKDL